jgi:hypothetical protein
MRHHDPERFAAEYVSGEMPRRASRWFNRHLMECDDCWRQVLLGRLGSRVASDIREAAPSALRDRVRARIDLEAARPERDRARRWWRR